MNLQIIKDCIAGYKEIIKSPDYNGWRLWELADQFQKSWDSDVVHFAEMFSLSFGISSPLWHRDHFYPKEAMERYIKINEDFVRSMFQDLFNENREIVGRIDRFSYQCDQMYKMDRGKTEKVQPHDHGNREMIFIYLAFRFPEQYSPYNFEYFKGFIDKVGSKNPYKEEDTERFVKVCRTLASLIQKDKELLNIVSDQVSSITGGKLFPMLMVLELYSLSNDHI